MLGEKRSFRRKIIMDAQNTRIQDPSMQKMKVLSIPSGTITFLRSTINPPPPRPPPLSYDIDQNFFGSV